jgi:hypothetical protein
MSITPDRRSQPLMRPLLLVNRIRSYPALWAKRISSSPIARAIPRPRKIGIKACSPNKRSQGFGNSAVMFRRKDMNIVLRRPTDSFWRIMLKNPC